MPVMMLMIVALGPAMAFPMPLLETKICLRSAS